MGPLVDPDAFSGTRNYVRSELRCEEGNRRPHGAALQADQCPCSTETSWLAFKQFEQFVYDENGQQLTSNFENYKLATTADVPSVEVHHEAGTPCPTRSQEAAGSARASPAPCRAP